jgi:hypothetical protein
MAILNTPVQGLPYPDANATVNEVDDYIANLAAAVETKLVMEFASATDRNTKIATPTEGMVCWLQDVNVLEAHDGTTWQQVWPASPAILSGTTAPTGSQGNVGDIYVQYV